MKIKFIALTAILFLASAYANAGGGGKIKPPQAQLASKQAGGGGKQKPPQAYSASAPWYVVWLGW